MGRNGLLAVALNPPDSWFNPPGLIGLATGRITRPAADPYRDYFPTWTPDGQLIALSVGLRATIWKFTPEVR